MAQVSMPQFFLQLAAPSAASGVSVRLDPCRPETPKGPAMGLLGRALCQKPRSVHIDSAGNPPENQYNFT